MVKGYHPDSSVQLDILAAAISYGLLQPDRGNTRHKRRDMAHSMVQRNAVMFQSQQDPGSICKDFYSTQSTRAYRGPIKSLLLVERLLVAVANLHD